MSKRKSSDLEESPDSDFEEKLASRLLGFDTASIHAAHDIAGPLEKLADYIDRKGPSESFSDKLLFFNMQDNVYRSSWKDDLSAVQFLTNAYVEVAYHTTHTTNQYRLVREEFSYYVKDKLPQPSGKVQRLTATEQKAMKTTSELAFRSLKLYTSTKEDFQTILENVYMEAEGYYRRLRQRFLKSAQPDDSGMQEMLFLIQQMEGLKTPEKYVKIKLIQENPLLTDFLLDLAELVPAYEERAGKKGKKIREVNEFALQNFSDILFQLADETFLNFLEHPKQFFAELGEYAQSFHSFFSEMEKFHHDLADISHVNILLSYEQREKMYKKRMEKIPGYLEKLKKVDFHLHQSEEEYLPNNRKEKEHFALREELLLHLYQILQEISTEKENEKKNDKIDKAVRKAASLKQQIEELLLTRSRRLLRRNKQEDNEYYEGKQGQIGMFYFERAPTPVAKMEEVIGESFRIAKEHLAEVIEAGVYSRVMSMSAPDGKVRSNILLIGPYGCGKTELARAVCADSKIIGANVSVRNILTAYMHESPNNVGRVYDAAKKLYLESGETKPIVLVLDEFDGFFNVEKKFKTFGANDMQQIELVLSEMLDGMGNYNGITTLAMTNNPLGIPKRIVRRFRYADVVGQLTSEERAGMLKMYLENGLPLHSEITSEHYQQWAEQLKDAPGDVVRKVADEVHFTYMKEFFGSFSREAQRMERTLAKWEQRDTVLQREKSRAFLKEKFIKYYRQVNTNEVSSALKNLLLRPSVMMQINKARKVYEDAEMLKQQLAEPEERPAFGLTPARRRDIEEELEE